MAMNPTVNNTAQVPLINACNFGAYSTLYFPILSALGNIIKNATNNITTMVREYTINDIPFSSMRCMYESDVFNELLLF